jgi:hypothetical protein
VCANEMSNESIIAIAALVVSVVTVAVSVWSGLAERKHMRLSIRPVAAIPVADFENRLAVWLTNKGLGPLRIKALTVTNAAGTIHPDLLSHMPDLPAGVNWTNFHGNADGVFLEAGKSLELLFLEGDPDRRVFREARDSIRRVLATLTIHVEYQDFYGKSMSPEERTLSWFGRHYQSGPGSVAQQP